MISLKAFLPTLARSLGLTPAALYERQRALIRLGIFPAPTARGRNSGGAMATPDTVAMMLIAVLATDNLSEMDQRIVALAKQKATDPTTGEPTRCGVSTETVLRRALETILSEPTTADTLSVEVTRHARKPVARLLEKGSDRIWTQFGCPPEGERIERKATFQNLHQLAMQLKDAKL